MVLAHLPRLQRQGPPPRQDPLGPPGAKRLPPDSPDQARRRRAPDTTPSPQSGRWPTSPRTARSANPRSLSEAGATLGAFGYQRLDVGGTSDATETTEIADGVHRISTYVEPPGLVFNQFLLTADEPLLFHTGMRGLFPEVSAAVQRIVPLARLRWVTFGHLEADECGSMNEWLQAAPSSQIAHGVLGCRLSINDMANRPPRQLADGEVVDLGGKRVRRIETPHVPHGWDAGLLFEETTGTLFCGDLFTALGRTTSLTENDIVGAALSAEDTFGALASPRPRHPPSAHSRTSAPARSA